MEIFGLTIDASVIWIGIAILFAIVEAVTLGLLTIWFTIGAVCAAVVVWLGGGTVLQIIVFFVVSVVLLYFTKPLAEKKLKIGKVKTNVDALAGELGVVVKAIEPFSTGQVKAAGQIWTALAEQPDQTVAENTRVRILRVEGVKLIVVPEGAPEQESGLSQ
ncbi:MAG: NfeD family protein [Bacillota bacterium]|nr:NfeD family protein [Bacillota bacterium]